MKLTEVELFNFKSIQSEKIKINRNQICFVGKNECGKSSIIQAISYLNFIDYEFSNKHINKSADSYPSGFPVVSGLFELSSNEFISFAKIFDENSLISIKQLCQPSNAIAQVNEAFKSFFPPKVPSINIKRWGNGIQNLSIILTDFQSYQISILETVSNPAVFCDQFYQSLFPVIEYYDNEELLLESATVDELMGSDRKFETFRRLLHIGECRDLKLFQNPDAGFIASLVSKTEDRLNKIIRQHYKQDDSIKIKIIPNFGDKLSIVIRDSSGESFSIDERSPGLRYYFSFLINRLYSTKIHHNRNQIYLLDEPGNNLHPQGAKDLLKTFNEIAKSSQILYTTHNPFLTIRNDVDSLIFVEKSKEKGTKIQRKSYLNKYQTIRKELGILLNDSFLIGDLNLIVEGPTEKLTFHRLFQIEKYQQLEWLNIYNAGGVGNIPQAMNYLGKNNLNLKGIVFLDSDYQAKEEQKTKGYKNSIASGSWEELEVNDAFNDKNDRTFEDLFPQELYVESFNEYCNGLKDFEYFDTEYSNYEYKEAIKTPIIDVLDAHFFSFIDQENKKKKSITKQDVMRYLLDKVDNMSVEEQPKVFVNCTKLLDKILISFEKLSKND
jgi:predicted ATP-dependent endonuclease of OLD family